MKPILTVTLMAAIMLSGCAERSASPESSGTPPTEMTDILIVDKGFHTTVFIEGSALRSVASGDLGRVLDDFRAARWYEIGWGNVAMLTNTRDFEALICGQTVSGTAGPTPAVVQLFLHSGDPRILQLDSRNVSVPIALSDLERLAASVSSSMATTDFVFGRYRGGSRNFRTIEQHIADYTCNAWIADRLRTAGVAAVGQGPAPDVVGALMASIGVGVK